jgi:zinc transport system substrate-binding protein
MSIKLISSLLLLAVLSIACADDTTPVHQDNNSAAYIVVVNNPLLYFTQRLIGDAVEVRLLVPEAIDPATWQPTVADILQLQGANLVVLNGAGYSSWLDKVSISAGRIVVTSAEAQDQWRELPDQITHSHGPGAEHAHSGYAFTTWMDMSLARVQAEAIAAALRERWPAQGDRIRDNLQTLLADIDELDAGYRQQADRLADRQIIYSHPVYQYFEERYRLPGYSLHWEPGVMPSDGQWGELENRLDDSSLLIWEGEPIVAIQKKLALLGLSFVVVDPAANTSERDWLAVQRGNVAALSRIVD